MHWAARIPNIPLLRRRHRIRLHIVVDGAALRRLWKEEQAGIFHIPGATSTANTFTHVFASVGEIRVTVELLRVDIVVANWKLKQNRTPRETPGQKSTLVDI